MRDRKMLCIQFSRTILVRSNAIHSEATVAHESFVLYHEHNNSHRSPHLIIHQTRRKKNIRLWHHQHIHLIEHITKIIYEEKRREETIRWKVENKRWQVKMLLLLHRRWDQKHQRQRGTFVDTTARRRWGKLLFHPCSIATPGSGNPSMHQQYPDILCLPS